MSTRAAIGRTAGDTFAGRYHHFDGYPLGLGCQFAIMAAQAPDLGAFLTYVVDEHRAGWSDISNANCYCHRTWEDGPSDPNEGDLITDCDLFIEWAYAINEATRSMGIFTAVRDYPGDDYHAHLIEIVRIDDWATIDWNAIERRGLALREATEATA